MAENHHPWLTSADSYRFFGILHSFDIENKGGYAVPSLVWHVPLSIAEDFFLAAVPVLREVVNEEQVYTNIRNLSARFFDSALHRCDGPDY
jgi:hypothetical protein